MNVPFRCHVCDEGACECHCARCQECEVSLSPCEEWVCDNCLLEFERRELEEFWEREVKKLKNKNKLKVT